MKKFKIATVIFVVSAMLFAIFRLVNLTSIPVFVDEAIYIRWSQIMKAEATLRFLPLSDGKQPLQMWLTIPFLKFFSDPLIAGRLISIIAGVGSMVGLAFLTFLLFDSVLLASISSLIYVILPFTVFFDRMALVDSLLAMFGIWTLSLSILFAKTRRLDHAMFVGFSLGGGLITKSPAIFFYVWLVVSFLFFNNFSEIKKNIKNILFGALAIIIISQGIYSILRLGPGFGMIGSRNQDYVFSFSEVLTHPLNPFVGNIKTTFTWLWLLFTPTVLVTLVLGFFDKKKIKGTLLLLTAGIIPIIAQASIAKVYTSRYVLYAVDLFIPIIAVGLLWLASRKGTLIKAIIPIIIAVPIVMSAMLLIDPSKVPMSYDMRSGYLEEWAAGWGQKEVAEYLIDLERQGNKIVVFTEGFFGTLPDGLQIYTEGHKDIIIVGSPPDVNRLPEGLVNTSLENKRFLLINKSRNHLPPAELEKLTLISEYPKTERLDGTREYLQFWQLK
ncbi:MAG: hypothetical protein UX41_C0019G0008 [Candidatus Collierbacteria bacterium GW2011_GWE1_46_18]|uniref:Glycosyltransferase RgtA/B/C/D-like domain-containing protein n=1 Tax=Candidatus Collierbacteria bacterium GW2011_GWE1_46_18 TaxID=1618399 RepID=A0A0G1P9V5_9BACT|nr:MAG: hypothetical protein UX41_C0019G0008 [Candidatus Collierbacteria bacterium GW2011_GWE1_46_18]